MPLARRDLCTRKNQERRRSRGELRQPFRFPLIVVFGDYYSIQTNLPGTLHQMKRVYLTVGRMLKSMYVMIKYCQDLLHYEPRTAGVAVRRVAGSVRNRARCAESPLFRRFAESWSGAASP